MRDGWLLCAEKTGNLNHIQESAMNILYQVMNRRIVAYMVVASGHADPVADLEF